MGKQSKTLVFAKIFATYSEMMSLTTTYRNSPIPSPLSSDFVWDAKSPQYGGNTIFSGRIENDY